MNTLINLIPFDVVAWLVGAVATVIAGWIAAILNKFVNARIDDKRQADLKKAVESAIMWIIAKEGDLGQKITVDEGVEYVSRSVPEAWEHFGRPAITVARQIEAGLKGARDLLNKIKG